MSNPANVPDPNEEVDDLDPDSSTPDELIAQEEKKKEAAQAILDTIANEAADTEES